MRPGTTGKERPGRILFPMQFFGILMLKYYSARVHCAILGSGFCRGAGGVWLDTLAHLADPIPDLGGSALK
jgi:hypothetical protein